MACPIVRRGIPPSSLDLSSSTHLALTPPPIPSCTLTTLLPQKAQGLGSPPCLFRMTPGTSVLCTFTDPEHISGPSHSQEQLLESASGWKVIGMLRACGPSTSQHSQSMSPMIPAPRCLPELPLTSHSLLPFLAWGLGWRAGQPPHPFSQGSF